MKRFIIAMLVVALAVIVALIVFDDGATAPDLASLVFDAGVPDEGEPAVFDPETAGAVALNKQFYQAVASADLGAMERIWAQTDDVTCVHPDWPPIRGWTAVRESWVHIFNNSEKVKVWPSDVRARARGNEAEVACIENMQLVVDGGPYVFRHVTINVYKRGPDGLWKLTSHRAMPHRPAKGPPTDGGEQR